MATNYDQEQDKRIAANTAAIKSLLKYIREIRNHFEPIYGLAEKVPRSGLRSSSSSGRLRSCASWP